jgi:DNA-binding transcriptional MerR regulator
MAESENTGTNSTIANENGSSKGNPAGAQQTSNTNPGIDYEKLADIVGKRTASAEDTVVKGYLKEHGVTAEAMDEALKDYKTKQETQRNAAAEQQKSMVDENTRLKSELLGMRINSKIQSLAEGVSADKLPYLSKLIDRSNLIDDKGEIKDDAVKAAIDEVIKSFPDFKTSKSDGSTGISKIGGDGNATAGAAEEKLRKSFGLK